MFGNLFSGAGYHQPASMMGMDSAHSAGMVGMPMWGSAQSWGHAAPHFGGWSTGAMCGSPYGYHNAYSMPMSTGANAFGMQQAYGYSNTGMTGVPASAPASRAASPFAGQPAQPMAQMQTTYQPTAFAAAAAYPHAVPQRQYTRMASPMGYPSPQMQPMASHPGWMTQRPRSALSAHYPPHQHPFHVSFSLHPSVVPVPTSPTVADHLVSVEEGAQDPQKREILLDPPPVGEVPMSPDGASPDGADDNEPKLGGIDADDGNDPE